MHCWCVMADRIEWNRKQNVQFVHSVVNTILGYNVCCTGREVIPVERHSSQIGVITYHLRVPTLLCLHQSVT